MGVSSKEDWVCIPHGVFRGFFILLGVHSETTRANINV